MYIIMLCSSLIQQFFFSLTWQFLKWRIVQLRYWNYKSRPFVPPNIHREIAFWKWSWSSFAGRRSSKQFVDGHAFMNEKLSFQGLFAGCVFGNKNLSDASYKIKSELIKNIKILHKLIFLVVGETTHWMIEY